MVMIEMLGFFVFLCFSSENEITLLKEVGEKCAHLNKFGNE